MLKKKEKRRNGRPSLSTEGVKINACKLPLDYHNDFVDYAERVNLPRSNIMRKLIINFVDQTRKTL